MPRTKSRAVPGQDFQIPLFSIFLDLVRGRSGAGLGQVWGRSGASFLAGTRNGFV